MTTVPSVPVISSRWAEPGKAAVRRNDRAERAGREGQHGQRDVLGLHAVRAGRGPGGDLGDRAHAPAEQVGIVDALVEQRSAVQGPGPPPGRGVVVLLGPVPLRGRLAEDELAEGVIVKKPPQLRRPGVEPVL